MLTSRRVLLGWLTGALLVPLAACGNGDFDARPAPGEEGIWTIRCATLRGQDRQRQAENRAAALRLVSKLDPERVQVFHTETESAVYYGWYRRQYSASSGKYRYRPNHLRDLELIRSLSVMVNDRPAFPFIYATMEELPTTRVRHPEWDLTNAMGYWSLQVAVFYNDDVITNRRYLAEEYCFELRGQGTEAYYHHGAVNSIVAVGLFPKQAIQTITRKDPWTGRLEAVNQIVDPRVQELQAKFTHNLQNGRRLNDVIRDPKTGEVKERIPLSSFLVKTPHGEELERQRAGGG